MAVASNETVAALVARELGLNVTHVRRQTRWRPTWFVDGDRDGVGVSVVVRGERVDTNVFPLKHEVRFHRLLQDHGIPVPKILGWIEDIDAVILEMVPGRPDFAGVSEADRDVIVDDYLQAIARIHQLPIAPFVEAGIHRAAPDKDPGTTGRWYAQRLFWSRKRHPMPFAEFCIGWVRRHPPLSHGREAPIIWDSGQFHHHDGRMVAVLDLEFGHLGDPMMDLAVWRMRDTLIPFGDFRKLYARYEELTGRPVDLEAIKRQHIAATIGNQLMFGAAILDPVPETDLMNNMQWTSETNLHATEAIAEYLDIELPAIDPPGAKRTRYDNTLGHLIEALKQMRTEDEFLRHDIRLAFRMARHLAEANARGDAAADGDLDDLHALLGYRPATWWEGDEALERFVLTDKDAGKHDEALVKLFHRRNLRAHLLLGPAGSKMVAHYSTQRFDGRPAAA